MRWSKHALVFHERSHGGSVDSRYDGTVREVAIGDGKRHCVWCEGRYFEG